MFMTFHYDEMIFELYQSYWLKLGTGIELGGGWVESRREESQSLTLKTQLAGKDHSETESK